MNIEKLAQKIDRLARERDRLFQELEVSLESQADSSQDNIKRLAIQLIETAKQRMAAVTAYQSEIEKGINNFRILADRKQIFRKKYEHNIQQLNEVLVKVNQITELIERNMRELEELMRERSIELTPDELTKIFGYRRDRFADNFSLAELVMSSVVPAMQNKTKGR